MCALTGKYADNIPQPLLQDIINNRCIPIIGAGFSLNAETAPGCRMPLWSDIAQHFAKQMRNYPDTNPLDTISAFCHDFSRAAAIEQLRNILLIDKSRPGPVHLAFADIPFDIVMTTNFDFLLERAYETRGKSYYAIVEEEQLAINGVSYDPYSQKKTTAILKIHGDLNHPKRMVLSEEDYDLYAERNPLMSTFVANLLVMRTPLFIGYSLDDPDFRAIWQIIGSRLGKLRRAAYTLSVTTNLANRARFERRGVKVIALEGSG